MWSNIQIVETHIEPLFKYVNLLKVSDILWKQLVKFDYKYKSANIHFLTYANIFEHSRTAEFQLCIIKPQYEYARYCIWNQFTISLTVHHIRFYQKSWHTVFKALVNISNTQLYSRICLRQNCHICCRH